MGLELTAFQKDEMGCRDLGLAVEELVDGKAQLWELASMMAEAKVGGAATLLQFREGGEATLHNTPHCWTSPPTPSHRCPLEFVEITAGLMSGALSDVRTTNDTIHIAYRLINRTTFSPYLAAIMWQFDGANRKLWIDCQDAPEGSKALVEALIKKVKRVHEASIFGIAVFNTFKILTPELDSISPPKGKGTKDPRKMATAHRRERCIATRKTDKRLHRHRQMWELELVARHEEFQHKGGKASKIARIV